MLFILMSMSMSKRIQIPVDEIDEQLFRQAARDAGLPVAEWARRIMRDAARGGTSRPTQSREAALQILFSENAPIGSVTRMNGEALEGRLL